MIRIKDNYEDVVRDEAESFLWSHGIKATGPRKAILQLLFSEKMPLNAQQLSTKLKKESLASIYRTLELFSKKGIVNIVNVGDRAPSYEIVSGRKHHHHVICTDCGDLEDVDDCFSEDLNKLALKHSKKFKLVTKHSLEFFGLCKNCS